MAKDNRPVFALDDADDNQIHAMWSRSGRRLMISVNSPRWDRLGQVELTHDQVDQLAAFLAQSKPGKPAP